MNPWLNFELLKWESDFDKEDVGYRDVNRVRIYSFDDLCFEIDMETMEILYIYKYEEEGEI